MTARGGTMPRLLLPLGQDLPRVMALDTDDTGDLRRLLLVGHAGF